MEEEIENLIEELTKVRPEMLNEEALKLFNTIMAILDERDKLREENKELKFCYEHQCENMNDLQNKILELSNDYENLQDSYVARNKLLKNSIPKSKIIEQLDKLDLDYEEQEQWDELYGSAAVTRFCKQLLKGE